MYVKSCAVLSYLISSAARYWHSCVFGRYKQRRPYGAFAEDQVTARQPAFQTGVMRASARPPPWR